MAAGAREIATVVRGTWGGGRVLLLPNGFVVKPLQNDDEVGRRVFIGNFVGHLFSKSLTAPCSTFEPGNPSRGATLARTNDDGAGVHYSVRWLAEVQLVSPDPLGTGYCLERLRGPDRLLGSGIPSLSTRSSNRSRPNHCEWARHHQSTKP